MVELDKLNRPILVDEDTKNSMKSALLQQWLTNAPFSKEEKEGLAEYFVNKGALPSEEPRTLH